MSREREGKGKGGAGRGGEKTHRLHLHYFQVNSPRDSQTTPDHQGAHKLCVRIS